MNRGDIGHMKQVIFSRQCDLKDKKEELAEAINTLYPVCRIVTVTKGNGSWVGEVAGKATDRNPEYLNVCHCRTQKIHSIYYKDLEIKEI